MSQCLEVCNNDSQAVVQAGLGRPLDTLARLAGPSWFKQNQKQQIDPLLSDEEKDRFPPREIIKAQCLTADTHFLFCLLGNVKQPIILLFHPHSDVRDQARNPTLMKSSASGPLCVLFSVRDTSPALLNKPTSF